MPSKDAQNLEQKRKAALDKLRASTARKEAKATKAAAGEENITSDIAAGPIYKDGSSSPKEARKKDATGQEDITSSTPAAPIYKVGSSSPKDARKEKAAAAQEDAISSTLAAPVYKARSSSSSKKRSAKAANESLKAVQGGRVTKAQRKAPLKSKISRQTGQNRGLRASEDGEKPATKGKIPVDRNEPAPPSRKRKAEDAQDAPEAKKPKKSSRRNEVHFTSKGYNPMELKRCKRKAGDDSRNLNSGVWGRRDLPPRAVCIWSIYSGSELTRVKTQAVVAPNALGTEESPAPSNYINNPRKRKASEGLEEGEIDEG
ncbi:hypothetical protein ACLMJK_006243 [Lecanora helva]